MMEKTGNYISGLKITTSSPTMEEACIVLRAKTTNWWSLPQAITDCSSGVCLTMTMAAKSRTNSSSSFEDTGMQSTESATIAGVKHWPLLLDLKQSNYGSPSSKIEWS